MRKYRKDAHDVICLPESFQFDCDDFQVNHSDETAARRTTVGGDGSVMTFFLAC